MRAFSSFVAVVVFLVLLPMVPANAQPELKTRDVVTGLDTPWEITWGPDGWIWFTERYGRISRVNPETGELHTLARFDVWENAEAGLLGMALHPNLADTPWVYVVYSYLQNSPEFAAEKLVRFTYDHEHDTLVDPVVLIDTIQITNYHCGSRLAFLPDHTLLLSLGDRGGDKATISQDHTTINGKTIRINPDGTVPEDNPWPLNPWPTGLLWSTGHRNPQGLVSAPNGVVYSTEHGSAHDDELNIIMKGRNYGYWDVQGYCDNFMKLEDEPKFCEDSNVVEPLHDWYWREVITVAPTGIDYYDGDLFPDWKNSLLITTLKDGLYRFKLSDDGLSIVDSARYFGYETYETRFGRLRDLCISPDGRIFIATSNQDGRARGDRGFPGPNDDRIIEVTPAPDPGVTISATTTDATAFKAGSAVSFTFSTTGTFGDTNSFAVMLSDYKGGLYWPRQIGSVQGTGGGTFTATLPCDLREGEYRIRLISNTPIAGGDPQGTLFTVSARPGTSIEADGPTTFCDGDSLTLTAADGHAVYQWSNGLSTRSIVVRTAGTYSVNTTDSAGCTGSAQVVVNVNPSPLKPQITRADSLLTASESPNYQWWRDGQIIEGATGQSYHVDDDGVYAVSVTNDSGCTVTSSPIQVRVSGVDWGSGVSRSVRISPHPVKTSANLEFGFDLGSGTVEIYDMNGRLVRSEKFGGGGVYRFHRGDLGPGLYLVQVSDGRKGIRVEVTVR